MAEEKKRGRPKVVRQEDLTTLQTRVPEALRTYLKTLSVSRFSTLIEMHETAFSRFLQERPYEQGLHIRKPKSATDTGWVQFNVLLPLSLKARIEADAENLGVSVASYLYTALYWWATYIYPPKR